MRIGTYLTDLFFPHTCPVCHEPLGEEESLCPKCMAQLPRAEQALQRDNSTEVLLQDDPHFRWGGCWLEYEKGSWLQQIMFQSKFGQGNPPLLRQLGQQAAREWVDTGFFDGIDLIMPIPLHPKRFRTRGFNQSEWIAKGLQDVLLLPMNTDNLTRERNNKKQSQSGREERQQIQSGLFAVNHPEELYKKTILIVDDIITTGATVCSAITAFKKVYGCKIAVFALAKAK